MMAYRFQIEDIRVEATAGVNANDMYLNNNLKEKKQQQQQEHHIGRDASQKLYNYAGVGQRKLDSLPQLPNDDDHPSTPPPLRLARSLRASPSTTTSTTPTRHFYSRIPTANLNNPTMMQQQQHLADDLYPSPLDTYLLEQQSLHQQHTLYQQQQQYYQHQQQQAQQQQQQQQHPHPHATTPRQPSSANGHFQPVHRHLPSTRSYSYHPYSSTPVTPATPSPPTSYLAPWDMTSVASAAGTAGVGISPYMFADNTYGSLLDYDYGSNGTIHPSQLSLTLAAATTPGCGPLDSGLHSFGAHALYTSPITINPTTISPYLTYGSSTTTAQQQQQQQLPTCIAPEVLYSPLPPMTPVSPRSLQDSSSSSDDSASNPSQSTRSSPTRLGLSIPTASLANPISNESWLNASSSSNKYNGSSNPSSTLSSPVESLSSHVSSDLDNDNEPSFVPPPSLKKSTQSMMMSVRGTSKRATRSAGPEPPAAAAAWVEAVMAEDARRLAEDVAAVSSTATSSPTSVTASTATSTSASAPARPTNRPIAFACVFCRHRKIQCIRPKTEVAPGEKPPPCNQCEKRNRCCEYPPAALNPRTVRRPTRPAGRDE